MKKAADNSATFFRKRGNDIGKRSNRADVNPDRTPRHLSAADKARLARAPCRHKNNAPVERTSHAVNSIKKQTSYNRIQEVYFFVKYFKKFFSKIVS